jgi:hypothetical protein
MQEPVTANTVRKETPALTCLHASNLSGGTMKKDTKKMIVEAIIGIALLIIGFGIVLPNAH